MMCPLTLMLSPPLQHPRFRPRDGSRPCNPEPIVDARATTLHADHLPPQAGMRVSKAQRTAPEGTTAMPELPPDAWGTVARAALAAEGSPAAWARLSLVSRAWRDGLAGAQINFQPVCLANAPVHHQVAVVLLCLLGWTLLSPGWPFCDEPSWCYR